MTKKPKKGLLGNVSDSRMDYVLAVVERSPNSKPLEIVISEVAFRRGEFPAPDAISVARWVYRWRRSGRLDLPLPRGKVKRRRLIQSQQEGE